MKLTCKVPIKADKATIWETITDINNAATNISGIDSVEVLEQPEDGLVGLKWKETRTMFGKSATETMWITDAETDKYYRTRAENHGVIYSSEISISEENGENYLSMSFAGEAQTFGAKIMSALMGWMMKSSTRKMVLQDLEDIKRVVESKTS